MVCATARHGQSIPAILPDMRNLVWVDAAKQETIAHAFKCFAAMGTGADALSWSKLLSCLIAYGYFVQVQPSLLTSLSALANMLSPTFSQSPCLRRLLPALSLTSCP